MCAAGPERFLGALGEALAVRWLRRRGYAVLARNFRADGVEADVVARRGEVLLVVEVKTRRGRWALPERAVDAAKRLRLERAAAAFRRRHPLLPVRSLRIDVLAVRFDREGGEVRHFPGPTASLEERGSADEEATPGF